MEASTKNDDYTVKLKREDKPDQTFWRIYHDGVIYEGITPFCTAHHIPLSYRGRIGQMFACDNAKPSDILTKMIEWRRKPQKETNKDELPFLDIDITKLSLTAETLAKSIYNIEFISGFKGRIRNVLSTRGLNTVGDIIAFGDTSKLLREENFGWKCLNELNRAVSTLDSIDVEIEHTQSEQQPAPMLPQPQLSHEDKRKPITLPDGRQFNSQQSLWHRLDIPADHHGYMNKRLRMGYSVGAAVDMYIEAFKPHHERAMHMRRFMEWQDSRYIVFECYDENGECWRYKVKRSNGAAAHKALADLAEGVFTRVDAAGE